MDDEEEVKKEEDEIKIEINEEAEDDSQRMCDLCPAVCKSAKSLQRHTKVMHDTRQFICPDCGASVIGVKALSDHRRIHRTFKCSHCNKEIGVKYKKRHLDICMMEELSCDQCDFKTTFAKQLERHKKTHQRHLCDQCPYQAKSMSKLDHHKAKKHGPEAEPHRQCVTIHKCGYCDYGSKFKSHVTRHEETCKVRKRQQTKVSDIGIVLNRDLGELFAETRTSEKDFNKIVHFFYKKCPEMFESHSYDAVKNYCSSLGWLHDSKVLEFRDSNGKPFFTTMGKVADVPDFIREIAIGKGIDINKIKCVVSADSGQGTFINYNLQVILTNYNLQIANYKSQITNHKLQITNNKLQITFRKTAYNLDSV